MADLTTLLSKFLEYLPLYSNGAPSGVLTSSTTQAATGANTDETDLWTYSLPANTLSVNGKAVRITVWFATAANTNTKTPRLYFGSTVLANQGTAVSGVTMRIQGEVYRTGAATQAGFSVWNGTNSTINVLTTPTETLSGAITIKATGQNSSANANDLVFRGAIVELLN